MGDITIADVAREAGVSKATVSRILNGNYTKASEETIRKVKQLMVKYDYRPSTVAQSLKKKRTQTVGVILSDITNPFFSSFLQGVGSKCHELGYNCFICDSSDDAALEEAHIYSLIQRQVDGLILNPVVQSSKVYEDLLSRNFPVVLANREIDIPGFDAVLMNNEQGMYNATERLIRNGRENIRLFITPLNGRQPRIDRVAGFKKAAAEYGLRKLLEDGICYVQPDCSLKEITERLRELRDAGNMPDAIISGTSRLSLVIYEALKCLHYRIPEDVAVIGYNEDIWSPYLAPPLTTVCQPAYTMGTVAVIHLINTICSPQDRSETICLDPQLVIRDSCGSKGLPEDVRKEDSHSE